jgi:hypothetical protein
MPNPARDGLVTRTRVRPSAKSRRAAALRRRVGALHVTAPGIAGGHGGGLVVEAAPDSHGSSGSACTTSTRRATRSPWSPAHRRLLGDAVQPVAKSCPSGVVGVDEVRGRCRGRAARTARRRSRGRWALDGHGPRGEPLEEGVAGVALEPVAHELAAAVGDEERRAHLGGLHHAEEVGVVAQLLEVVGRRRGGAGQPVRGVGKPATSAFLVVPEKDLRIDDSSSTTAPNGRVEEVQALVVGDAQMRSRWPRGGPGRA